MVEDAAPVELVELLQRVYPALLRTPGLLRLAVHLLRTPDRTDGKVPLPWQLLSAIVGRTEAARHKKAVTAEVLGKLGAALQATGSDADRPSWKVLPHNRHQHLATRVQIGFPDRIEELALRSKGVPKDDRITVEGWCRVQVDGTWRRFESAAALKAQRIARLPDPSHASPLSQRLQAYLNGHDSRVYQSLRKLLKTTEIGQFVRTEFPAPEQQHTVVATIRDVLLQPVPVYKTSPRTARISAVGRNLTSVPSTLRHHLTRRLGWLELDLAHAQLACNAAAWGVTEATRALSMPGYRFWDDLMEQIGPDPESLKQDDPDLYRDLKKALKKPVHGVSFGMKPDNVRYLGLLYKPKQGERARVASMLRRTCGLTIRQAGLRLAAHPLVAAMLEAREAQMALVKAEGGRVDVFGVPHPIVKAVRKGPGARKGVTPRKVLARVAQAQELDLMSRVIEDAVREGARAKEGQRPMYRIVVWQHDGFTVSPKGNDEATQKAVGRRLQKLLAEQAQFRGVPTALEVDVGPDLG